MSEKAKQAIKRFEKLKADRATWESHWQEITNYCLPRKAKITQTRVQGTKTPTDIYDTTGIVATNMLASGLAGDLTSASSRWFNLRLSDEQGNIVYQKDSSQWLVMAEKEIYKVLAGSNFYQEIYDVYLDLASVGTGCLYAEEDPKTYVRFYSRPINEIYIAEDERGRVDTVFRYFTFTARQAWLMWSENAGKSVKDAMEKKEYEKEFTFLHKCSPRFEFNPAKKTKDNMPWESLYINVEDSKVIGEGGYFDFPFFVPRFYKVSSEVYGYSPASQVLPDIKMANKIQETIIKASQLGLLPPLQVPMDGFIMPLNYKPGGLLMRKTNNPLDKVEPLVTGINLPIGLQELQVTQEKIKKAFFVDLFLMLSQQSKEMTATEVMKRVEEKMTVLGPVLGRLMSDLLQPCIVRVLNILIRNKNIPEPPFDLAGKEYTVEFVSPLARSQKLSQVNNITTFLEIVGQAAQIEPSVLDNIDLDNAIREIADMMSLPTTIIKNEETVAKIREIKQQQLAQQQQLQNENVAADTVNKGAKAVKELLQ